MIKKFVKGFSAGFLIGLAGALFLVARSNGYKFLPALVFPVGLFLICVFKLDLYTGKIGFVFDRSKGLKIDDLVLMLISNAVGAIVFGLVFTAIFSGNAPIAAEAKAVARSKFIDLTLLNMGVTLLKSALCGMLVYIGVFMFGQRDNFVAKTISLWIPIAVFVYLGLDHSIANMFYLSAMFSFSLNGAVMILVAIVGNSLGAIFFDRIIYIASKGE